MGQAAGAGGGPATCQRCPEAGLDLVRSGHFIPGLSYSLIPPPGSWQRGTVEPQGEGQARRRSTKDEELEREQKQLSVCGQFPRRKTRRTSSRPSRRSAEKEGAENVLHLQRQSEEEGGGEAGTKKEARAGRSIRDPAEPSNYCGATMCRLYRG